MLNSDVANGYSLSSRIKFCLVPVLVSAIYLAKVDYRLKFYTFGGFSRTGDGLLAIRLESVVLLFLSERSNGNKG